jgi:hypothetical protein
MAKAGKGSRQVFVAGLPCVVLLPLALNAQGKHPYMEFKQCLSGG